MEHPIWSHNTRRARRLPVLMLAACALILMGMAVLDRVHAYQVEQSLAQVRDIQQTHGDLLANFQRLSAERDSVDTAALESGRQALLQALTRLQLQAEALGSTDLDANIVDMRQRLLPGAGPFSTSALAGLQQALLGLGADVERMELAQAGRFDGLLHRQQIHNAIGWLLVFAALGLLGLGVAKHSRELWLAQTALQEKDAKSQRLLDMLPQLVWTCDAQARIEYFNQRWVEYTGVSMQDLLDKGWAEVMHPDDVATIVAAWAEVVRRGATSLPEFRLRRRDGSYRWFNAHFGVSHNEQGQPVRWFGSSVDVEDVRSARAALEHSERFYREALNGLGEGVLIFDTERRVTDCNPAAERIWGMPRAALVSLPYQLWSVTLAYEDGRDLPWTETPVSQVLATGESCRDMLIQLRQRGGKAFWLLVTAEPLRDANGQITAVVASYRNVTERRRAQQELIHNKERLEAALAERTRELAAEVEVRKRADQALLALQAKASRTKPSDTQG